MKHVIKNLHRGTVNIALIGAGGTGSLVLSGLVRLNHAIRQLGHPGIEVNVYDPDFVTEANIGRQLFTAEEIGQNKAQCLVDRYNLGFALQWNAYPRKYTPLVLWFTHLMEQLQVLAMLMDQRILLPNQTFHGLLLVI